jgi:hypothetical protein
MNINPFHLKMLEPATPTADEDMRRRNIKRVEAIKHIAGHYFDQAPKGRPCGDVSVVVPAEVLLKVWELASRLEEDI